MYSLSCLRILGRGHSLRLLWLRHSSNRCWKLDAKHWESVLCVTYTVLVVTALVYLQDSVLIRFIWFISLCHTTHHQRKCPDLPDLKISFVERNSGRRLGSKPPLQYNSMRLSFTFFMTKAPFYSTSTQLFFFLLFIFFEKSMYPPSPKLRDCLEYTLYVFAKYNHSYQLLQEFKHPNEKSSRTNNLYTWFLQEIIR